MNLKLISFIVLLVILQFINLRAEDSKIVFHKNDGSYSSFNLADIETIEFEDSTTKNKIRFYKLGDFDEFYLSNISELKFDDSKLKFKYGINDFHFNFSQIDSMVIYESNEPFYNFVNFNKNYYFMSNNQTIDQIFIDSNYYYFADLGCANAGLTVNGLDLQFKEFKNNSIFVNQIQIKFLDYIYFNIEETHKSEVRYEDDKGEVLYSEEHQGYNELKYINFDNDDRTSIDFNHNSIILRNFTNNKENKYLLEFKGIDSLKFTNSKQNEVLVFFNNKVILLPKLYYRDAGNLDTIYYDAKYIINNNKIGLYAENFAKDNVIEFVNFIEDTWYDIDYDTTYVESERYELNDSILYAGEYFRGYSTQILKKSYFTNDYLRNLENNKNYIFPTKLKNKLYQKVYNDDYLRYEFIYTTYNLDKNIELITFTQDKDGYNHYILFKTNTEFNDIEIEDDPYYLAYFDKSKKYNYLLSKLRYSLGPPELNIYCDLFGEYFDDKPNGNEFEISNLFIDDDPYNLYFMGSVNLNSLTDYGQEVFKSHYIGKSKQKAFIFKYNIYYKLPFNGILIGSESENEFVHINSLNMLNETNNGNSKTIYFSGLTNSQSLFADTKFNKTTSDIDNFMVKIDGNFDSIYNVKYIGGIEDECDIENYKTTKNFLFSIDNNEFILWGITKSKEFNNLTKNVIKNSKNNESFDVFAVNLDNNLEIKKLLFIESNSDDFLQNVLITNDGISSYSDFVINVRTKANDFPKLDFYEYNYLDINSNNTKYLKNYVAIIPFSLFVEYLNDYIYRPKFASYIESEFGDVSCVSPYIYYGDHPWIKYLKFGLNTNHNKILNNFKYDLNNNSNNVNSDGFLVKFILENW